METCKFYTSGYCRFGSKCRYKHPKKEKSPDPVNEEKHRMEKKKKKFYACHTCMIEFSRNLDLSVHKILECEEETSIASKIYLHNTSFAVPSSRSEALLYVFEQLVKERDEAIHYQEDLKKELKVAENEIKDILDQNENVPVDYYNMLKCQYDNMVTEFEELKESKEALQKAHGIDQVKLRGLEEEIDDLQDSHDALYEERDELLMEIKSLKDKVKSARGESKALERQLSGRSTPEAIIEQAELDQIAIAGSKHIYDRLNRYMRQGKLDLYFGLEQIRLYEWREKFFWKNFGDPSPCGKWMIDYHDEYCIVPYQITQKFDKLVTMISKMNHLKTPVPLRGDEIDAHNATLSFDTSFSSEGELPPAVCFIWDDEGFDDYKTAKFNVAAHLIVEKYKNGPNKLQHLAMKAALANNLPLDSLPKEIYFKSKRGMFYKDGPIPDNLSSKGRSRYMSLLEHSKEDEFDYSQSPSFYDDTDSEDDSSGIVYWSSDSDVEEKFNVILRKGSLSFSNRSRTAS